jgi:hypothetical protein
VRSVLFAYAQLWESAVHRLAERERGSGRRVDRRKQFQEEKQAALNEKRAEFKSCVVHNPRATLLISSSKEDQTMAMFREMAAARFGGGT